MARIMDFRCTYDHAAGLGEWAEKDYDISFPQAYSEREMMVKLALAVKEHNGAQICQLPFCHTLEAEALGGAVKLGDGVTGPRAKEFVCRNIEDLRKLPKMDLDGVLSGRICETLEACRILKEQGMPVLFQVSGPLTILGSLIDSEVLFRALLKEPDVMMEIFHKLGLDMLRLMKKAEAAGAEYISYADPSGGVNIVGPRVAALIAREFTTGFLEKVDAELKPETMVLLCPKTALTLIGSGQAVWKDRKLPEVMEYSKAISYMKGKVRFSGQACINHVGHCLENRIFKELIISGCMKCNPENGGMGR